MLALAGINQAFMQCLAFAQEAEEDIAAKDEAEAKEALRLYKEGRYEEAAKLFAKLSVDYPNMPIFERNVGACFYYLKKPGPALSNLRNYLNHKQDIADDDKAVVDRWIAEMEKLRQQEEAPAKPPTQAPAQPVPTVTTVPKLTPSPTAPVSASLNVSAPNEREKVREQSRPFYETWWFWTGTVAVIGGGVTAYLLATHRGTQNACNGASISCDAIK
jgi:tetratricopeptide (TPR) repeat protein